MGSTLLGEDEALSAWISEASLAEDGKAAFHVLSAASLLRTASAPQEAKAEEAHFSALGILLALFQAERVFLFEAAPVRGGNEAPALGRALATRNADEEQVSEPEK